MNKLILSIITLTLIAGLCTTYAQSDSIPTWIKNTALWYGQNDVNDDEFFGLIQFLDDV